LSLRTSRQSSCQEIDAKGMPPHRLGDKHPRIVLLQFEKRKSIIDIDFREAVNPDRHAFPNSQRNTHQMTGANLGFSTMTITTQSIET
jgi:hypothetical protein